MQCFKHSQPQSFECRTDGTATQTKHTQTQHLSLFTVSGWWTFHEIFLHRKFQFAKCTKVYLATCF
eukprot:m.47341 g.47341  ORF g.47341 m.47341 type:complete len:66 (+) comp10973_c0_seq1:142-339(+)